MVLRTCGKLVVVFSTEVNLLYFLYSMDQMPCLLHLIKQNYLRKTFDSGISFPVFPSRTNLKLHNISITPKIVKKVITNLDSSKASGHQSELSYILAELSFLIGIHSMQG